MSFFRRVQTGPSRQSIRKKYPYELHVPASINVETFRHQHRLPVFRDPPIGVQTVWRFVRDEDRRTAVAWINDVTKTLTSNSKQDKSR